MPSLENKKVIIKLIVSPFDSFGRTFLSEKESDYASKNGESFTEVFLKEGPYYSLENSNLFFTNSILFVNIPVIKLELNK